MNLEVLAEPTDQLINSINFKEPTDSFISAIDIAENTGGNVYNDIIELKSGHLIVVTSDVICIYGNREGYENNECLTRYILLEAKN